MPTPVLLSVVAEFLKCFRDAHLRLPVPPLNRDIHSVKRLFDSQPVDVAAGRPDRVLPRVAFAGVPDLLGHFVPDLSSNRPPQLARLDPVGRLRPKAVPSGLNFRD